MGKGTYLFNNDDRRYWEPVIKELKMMKEKNQLLPEGSRPSDSVLCNG